MRRLSTVASGLVAALFTSALAGVLIAALVLPFVGGAGLAAKWAADQFLSLPPDIEPPTPAQRSKILDADGSLIAWLYRENRVRVPLSAVPEHVQQALLAIEDARFYEHNGVDVQGAMRAAVENAVAGSVQQGGSTLTQQYVKNALITDASTRDERHRAQEQSLGRKVREARMALSRRSGSARRRFSAAT